MQMKNGLSGAGADVGHRPVAMLDVALAGNFGGSEMAAADQFRIFRLRFF